MGSVHRINSSSDGFNEYLISVRLRLLNVSHRLVWRPGGLDDDSFHSCFIFLAHRTGRRSWLLDLNQSLKSGDDIYIIEKQRNPEFYPSFIYLYNSHSAPTLTHKPKGMNFESSSQAITSRQVLTCRKRNRRKRSYADGLRMPPR